MSGVAEASAAFQADPALRVAVFTGAGDPAFCAGGDLGETIGLVNAGGRKTTHP